MRAREFIFEDYKDAKKEFSRVADPQVVQDTIDQYRELVKKNQFRNPIEKNIDHWRERGWEAFSQMVKLKSSDITDTQRKRGKVVGNAISLQDDDEWTVVIPLDKESSVHYGKGTEWCTTKPNLAYYEQYVYERNITLIYAIDKTKSGRSVAISIKPAGKQIQMFNQNDKPIDSAQYKEISGLDSAKFINMAALPETQQQLTASREKYKVADKTVKTLLAEKPLNPEAIERELKITKKSEDCYSYIFKYGQEQNKPVNVHPIIIAAAAYHVENHGAKRLAPLIGQYIDFPNLPSGLIKTILRSSPGIFVSNFKLLSAEQQAMFALAPASAYHYAAFILNEKPFPAGEPAIAKDAFYSYYYSISILNNPFPAGEPAIATNADFSYMYASNFFNGVGWPLGEAIIAKNGANSYYYATRVIKKPFPLGESEIFKDKFYWKDYTVGLLKDHRSPSWEQLIKNDPEKSFVYAQTRNKPFPAGEAAIATNPKYAAEYDQLFGTNLAQR